MLIQQFTLDSKQAASLLAVYRRLGGTLHPVNFPGTQTDRCLPSSPSSLAPAHQHPGKQLPVCQPWPASYGPALICSTLEDSSTIQWAATHPLCQGLSPSLEVMGGAVLFQALDLLLNSRGNSCSL